MALLSAFNPHELKADTVLKVATGRDEPLARLLDIIRSNLTAPTKQHVIISAPRGYGKSFLLRYVQVRIEEIAKNEGLPIAMALLSEELPHVKEPDTLLAEIRRTFLNEPADTVGVRWVEDDGEAWYQRVAELDATIAERLGGNGLLVAGVENFDLLVRKAFAKDVHGGSLREFLTRKGNHVMLLAASARGAFDRDYDRPLFKAFEEIALEPWSVDECVAFFRAQRAAAGKQPLTEVQEAKAKAVATFIGGTPRLATLIGEALLEDDPLRAAELLDKLVDELTPYYKERIEALPTRSQALLDGLLRSGEKCSATELARRVGAPNQPAIAAPLDELRKDLVIVGEKAPGSAEVLLRVTDRVFAHYYRKRILSHGQETCPLEALVDLLAVFYSPEEQKREAERLKARGLAREAAVMERLWQTEQAMGATVLRPRLERERDATFKQRMDEWDRVTDEGRYEEGLLILDRAISAARAIKDADAECQALSQRAWTLMNLDRYDEALAIAREAAALAERMGYAGRQAGYLNLSAFSLTSLGRYDDALATAREAATLAERSGDVGEQLVSLRQAAFSLANLGRYDEALATARQAAALAERGGHVSAQADSLRHAAFSLNNLGRYDEALAIARNAAALAERSGDVGEQVDSLSQAAFSLNSLGRYDEALATAREAAALAARGGDVGEQVDSLGQAAFSLNNLGRYDEALATAREAAALAERSGDVGQQVDSLRHAAFSLTHLERYDEALVTAREAAALAERSGDVGQQAAFLSEAAFNLNKLGRYDDALATAREVAALAERTGDFGEQVDSLRQAVFSLNNLGRYDEALATAREAAALAERSGDLGEQVAFLRRAAFSLNNLGRHDEALATAREAAALAERTGDLGEQVASLNRVAFSLNNLERHDEALATARETAALAEGGHHVSGQVDSLRHAAFSLSSLGRHDEALATSRECFLLATRVGNINVRRYIAGLLLSFQTLIELDEAFTSYEILVDPDSSTSEEDAALWFDDIAHIVTLKTAWPRLVLVLERSPRAGERIIKDSDALGGAGEVIAAAHAANQCDTALLQARHLIAALTQAIETATHPALARLWVAVLNASAERIATKVEDAAFLREFGDILVAHAGVPERARSLIVAATAYHAGGRDRGALARLEPDLATTLMAVFPPKAEPMKRERKPRARRKS